MTIDFDTIITLGAVVSAIVLILGILFKFYKFYLEQGEQSEEIAEIKQDQKDMKIEQRLIIESLLSIHDGLEQLGCNHTVPEGKRRLQDYLNEQAHK